MSFMSFYFLTDIRRAAINFNHAVPDDQPCAAFIGKTDADAGILHRAGDPGAAGIRFVDVFDGEERFFQRSRAVGDLTVGEDRPGFDRVPEIIA